MRLSCGAQLRINFDRRMVLRPQDEGGVSFFAPELSVTSTPVISSWRLPAHCHLDCVASPLLKPLPLLPGAGGCHRV